MALISNIAPIELTSASFGRLLAKRLTIGVYVEVEKRIKSPIEVDEFTAKFFPIVARRVEAAAPTTDESFKAGRPITEGDMNSLSDEERDSLAAAYFASAEVISSAPKGEKREERPVERPSVLLRNKIMGDLVDLERRGVELAPTISSGISTDTLQSFQREIDQTRSSMAALNLAISSYDTSAIRTLQEQFKVVRQYESIFDQTYRDVLGPTSAFRRAAEEAALVGRGVFESIQQIKRTFPIENLKRIQDSISSSVTAFPHLGPAIAATMKSFERERKIFREIAQRQSSLSPLLNEQFTKTAQMVSAFSTQYSKLAETDAITKLSAALRAASVVTPLDGGLLIQSLAAVAARELNAPAVEALKGRSFLADALETIESWPEPVTEPETAEEAATSPESLLAAILELFLRYFSEAKTLFESEALTQALVLMLAAATLYVNILAVQVARQAAQDSSRDAAAIRQAVEASDQSAAERATAQIAQNDRVIAALERIDEHIAAKEFKPSPPTVWYLVKRLTPLKMRRLMKSETVLMLSPVQVVELVSRHSDWIKVRVYDYLTCETHTGWAKKKYLKMVK